MLLELNWSIRPPLPSQAEISIPFCHALPSSRTAHSPPSCPVSPSRTAHSPAIMPSDSSFRSCTYLSPAAFPGLMAGTGSQSALGSDDVTYESWLADELQPLHKGQVEEVFLFLGLSAHRYTQHVSRAFSLYVNVTSRIRVGKTKVS